MRGTVPAVYSKKRIVQKPIPVVEPEIVAEAGEENIVNLETSVEIVELTQQTTDSAVDVAFQSGIDVVDEVEKITNATEREDNVANPQENVEIEIVADQNRLDDENIKNEVIISRTAHAEIDNILSQCTVAVVGSTCVESVLSPEIVGGELITAGTADHIIANDISNVAAADRLNTNSENIIASETTSDEDLDENVINFYDSDGEAITMAFTGKKFPIPKQSAPIPKTFVKHEDDRISGDMLYEDDLVCKIKYLK